MRASCASSVANGVARIVANGVARIVVKRVPRIVATAVSSIAVIATLTTVGSAQMTRASDTRAADATPACLRFQFGVWSPALNWKGAGHVSTLDTSKVERTADGRAWAAPAAVDGGDSVLVLYPAFWPAGVALSFDARTLVIGDTAVAKATAFVADARLARPIAPAKVWRVECHA
jgi:hypothetical protein